MADGEPLRRGGCAYGRWALALLLVTVASGVPLAGIYRADQPFASTERILAGVPWGWWLRGIHWFAATGLLVTTAAHLFEMVRLRRERTLGAAVWWRSTLLVPLTLAAMLGGFVLRGDAEAIAAGAVWRGLLDALPLVGDPLRTGLLGADAGTSSAALIHHVGTFTLAIWLLTTEHGQRVWPDRRTGSLAAIACVALAAIVPIGLGPAPDSAGAALSLGPWYLLGLQGMLLDVPVALAWLAPLAGLVMLGALAHANAGARRALVVGLALLAIAYAGWTARMLAAAGGG